MQLRALVDGFGPLAVRGSLDVAIDGVAMDSRQVRPGDVFVALAGLTTDGRRHVGDAVSRGARAIIADAPVEVSGDVTVIHTAGARRLLGLVASRLAGEPSHAMTVVGITGTNGKTTTTYLLEGIWRAAGHATGVIGTIAYRIGDVERPAPFTTPEAPMLQALLADMRTAGTTHVAMEVSSHALEQGRADAIRFAAAVFTNLTRDHLDFHGDLERYYAAKARLFTELLPSGGTADPVSIVNVDDAAGRRLAASVPGRCVTVGRA
ncbi:MAG TPA: Mur ligase family protein, partial [Candidatus Binatia bacterium]|nr:Mur ligase family protein [Candidatus Binatia bacterium]